MAGDVVYADLNIPGASSSSRPPQGSPHLNSPPCPRWHRIAVGAGWAGNVVLTVAVIMLGVWVSQLRGSGEGRTGGARNTLENSETGVSSTECSSCLEDFRSRLKPILCEPHSFPETPLWTVIRDRILSKMDSGVIQDGSSCVLNDPMGTLLLRSQLKHGSSRGGARCKLCPRDWLLRGDKCYWLSKGSKNWARSRDDCSGKSSQLLVLQSQQELASIQNVTQDANSAWIGLKVTPPRGNWTWVDGSPLDPARFPVSGPADRNSCGWIRGSQIQWETCDAEFKWICQRDAVMI